MNKHLQIVAIIQARMGSKRFPGKSLAKLNDMPIIEWVYRRVSRAKMVKQVIIAIPDNSADDLLANYASKKLHAKVFRGDEQNVLARFYAAAVFYQASDIVRICADNPFIVPEEIDRLIKFYCKENCDYAYNHIPKNNLYPDGLGAEIISFNCLQKIYQKAILAKHLEHCFSYIWDNEDQFIIRTFDPLEKNIHHPDLKFDIDTEIDLQNLAFLKVKLESSAKEIVEKSLKWRDKCETKRIID